MLFQIIVGYHRDVIMFTELEEWYNCGVCFAETQRTDVICGMAWRLAGPSGSQGPSCPCCESA